MEIQQQLSEALLRLEALANPANVAGMARSGIVAAHAYGVNTPTLRRMAKELGRNHELALALWQANSFETRVLAALVADPGQTTEALAESWAAELDNWAVCDGLCANLLEKTPFAYPKAVEWSARPEEFVKRAGFVLMARLAVSDRKAPDSAFLAFLPIIRREALDERNYVKKAVNWALRQIGKRNRALNQAAIAAAQEIRRMDSRAARWVAADALRELTGEATQRRLKS